MEKSIMWEYIKEIPQRAKKLINHNQILNFINQYDVKKLNKIIFIGSGSSYNITSVSKGLFEKYADVFIESYTPLEFMNVILRKYNPEKTLVIAISQTGTSSGTINGIKYAKRII